MRNILDQWLQRVWYQGSRAYWMLLPFSGIYWVLITLRRYLYRFGVLRQEDVGVPVIVVICRGNESFLRCKELSRRSQPMSVDERHVAAVFIPNNPFVRADQGNV